MRVLMFLVAVPLLQGCATSASYMLRDVEDKQECLSGKHLPYVYSGTIVNIRCLAEGGFFFVLDIPFSLVADTVLLPVSIPMEVDYQRKCKAWKQEAPNTNKSE